MTKDNQKCKLPKSSKKNNNKIINDGLLVVKQDEKVVDDSNIETKHADSSNLNSIDGSSTSLTLVSSSKSSINQTQITSSNLTAATSLDGNKPARKKVNSSKSTNDKFHQLFPSVALEEHVIDTYSCAYVKSLNLYQGVMFLTQNYICFYSKIIKNENILKLKLTDIKEIIKTMHALIFPTAIRINTQNSSYSFTSFRSRSHTLDHLLFLWTQARDREFDRNVVSDQLTFALNNPTKDLAIKSGNNQTLNILEKIKENNLNISDDQEANTTISSSQLNDESTNDDDGASILSDELNDNQINPNLITNSCYSYYNRPDIVYDFDCDLSKNMVRVSLRHKRTLLQKVKILLSLLIPGFFDMSRLDALLPICFIMCVLLLLNAFVLLNKVNQVDDLFTKILSNREF